MAAFTLVVMTESSTYSPVLSLLSVPAHPRKAVISPMQIMNFKMPCNFAMTVSPSR
jgi:hypothetical protein